MYARPQRKPLAVASGRGRHVSRPSRGAGEPGLSGAATTEPRRLPRAKLSRLLITTSAMLVAWLLALPAAAGPAPAAFSGTNGKIAFSTLSYWGDLDVFVMNADGSELVALTTYGADDSQPAFSPDGSRSRSPAIGPAMRRSS